VRRPWHRILWTRPRFDGGGETLLGSRSQQFLKVEFTETEDRI
jgi:hypothetical protein